MEPLRNITIVKQPAWVTDDEIADILHDAHQTTLAAGMHYAVLNQDGKDIRKRLGPEGVFFVALLDGNKPVGVSGVSLYKSSHSWYVKGKAYAEVELEGVRNAYKGMGINSLLHKAIYDYAFQYVDVLVTNTAEQNHIVIRNDLKRGWKIVDYGSWRTTNYYSVVMAKWKTVCPFSDVHCRLRFMQRKLIMRLAKNRFGQYRFPFSLLKS